METEVTATKFSLFGIDSLLWFIEEDVTFPLKIQRYGATNKCEQDQLDRLKPSPKFILISGCRGSGKSALTSVLVNELRKGPLTKSADIFYRERDVKYLTFEGYTNDHNLIGNLRGAFSSARCPIDGRDFTVLVIPDMHFLCPRENGMEGERQPQSRQRRRRPRPPVAVEFINALIQELDMTPPGRLLVVGHTSEPEEVDTVLKAKLDHSYAIPLLTEHARRAMIPEFLEELGAVCPSDVVGFFVRCAEKYRFTPGDMRDLLHDVVGEAKYRIRIERRVGAAGEEEHPNNNEQIIMLIKNDFLFCLDGNAGDQGQGPEAPIGAVGPQDQQPPVIDLVGPDAEDEGYGENDYDPEGRRLLQAVAGIQRDAGAPVEEPFLDAHAPAPNLPPMIGVLLAAQIPGDVDDNAMQE